MKETRQLEFKSDISNTFLKTVSAFANYDVSIPDGFTPPVRSWKPSIPV